MFCITWTCSNPCPYQYSYPYPCQYSYPHFSSISAGAWAPRHGLYNAGQGCRGFPQRQLQGALQHHGGQVGRQHHLCQYFQHVGNKITKYVTAIKSGKSVICIAQVFWPAIPCGATGHVVQGALQGSWEDSCQASWWVLHVPSFQMFLVSKFFVSMGSSCLTFWYL